MIIAHSRIGAARQIKQWRKDGGKVEVIIPGEQWACGLWTLVARYLP